MQILTTIARILGNYKFLQAECYLRKQHDDENKTINSNTNDFPILMIKYFLNEIMTEQEKIRLRSFNILKPRIDNERKKQGTGVFLPRNMIGMPHSPNGNGNISPNHNYIKSNMINGNGNHTPNNNRYINNNKSGFNKNINLVYAINEIQIEYISPGNLIKTVEVIKNTQTLIAQPNYQVKYYKTHKFGIPIKAKKLIATNTSYNLVEGSNLSTSTVK